jgi:hypothetical protein
MEPLGRVWAYHGFIRKGNVGQPIEWCVAITEGCGAMRKGFRTQEQSLQQLKSGKDP